MSARKILFFLFVLLSVHLVAACALLDKDKALPPQRTATVLVFPTGSLEFKNVTCTQEYGKMTLTGEVQNVSLSPVANVRIRATVLFSGDSPGDYTNETFNLAVDPLVLQPSEFGRFSLVGTVHKVISHVELHVRWDPFIP